MLKRKRNFFTESRIEPIIVMIDARRLSKSLATALKDRAHGIPVQPNHSLPLRPAPLLPIRKTLTNSTENLITNCPNITQVLSSDREDNDDVNGIDDKDKEKKGENLINEFIEMNYHREDDDKRNEITNRALIGMNFYDSVVKKNNSSNELDGNSDKGINFINEDFKDEKKIGDTKKSFDGEKLNGELKLYDNHRKLFEHRDTGCVTSDIINKKKRRISNSDEKNNLKFLNDESREFLTKKQKLIKDDDNVDILGIDKEAKILKTVETENSKNKFPNIFRYRVPDKKNSQDFVSMDDNRKIRDKIKIKSSIILKETLSKPYCLPDCPEAVPIEIAQAINRNDLLIYNRKNIIKNINDKDLLLSSKKKLKETIDNRFIESNKYIGKDINEEEIGFTSLPSMPTLEDGKTDPLSGMLTPPKEPVNDEEEEEEEEEGDCRSNLIGEAASMLEAEINKVKELNGVYDDFNEQESIDRIKKFEKQKNENNLSNISTVFELKIPGRSPELIFINNNNEKLLTSEKFFDSADESLAEATTPESLTLSVEPAFEERRIKTDDEFKNVEVFDKSIKFSSSQSVEEIEDRKEKSFDKERKKKSPEDVIRERIERLDKKLEKFIKEENNLKFELSKTKDSHRITELNPKINCARKKKENIEKQLDKLRSKEKSNFDMKIGGGNVPRIQVRKDLIQSIPSTILKSEEPVIRSIDESDETSMIKSPPIVITISESDTSSSSSSSSEEEEEEEEEEKEKEEEEETVKTVSKEGETRLEESSVQPESEITRDTVIAENFTPSVPENLENVVFDIPESIDKFNEADKTRTRIICNEDNEETSEIVSKESCEMDSEKELLTLSINEEYKKKLTKEFENPVISETLPSKIAPSINEERPTILEKNNFKNAQLNVPSFNACNCRRCPGYVIAEGQAKSNVASITSEINFPSKICSENKSSGMKTVIEDNRSNVYPSENYPTDYRMRGNFSRDNGGAISDLSSPLQGHSALPLPQPYVQNLTAQGYPPPPFTVPENHQTTLPVSKSSSVVNLASKQEDRLKSPILAAHLLTTRGQEVPANLSVGKKIISPATNVKEIQKGNFEYGATTQIMTAQFPTLANWVAEQISRKPVSVGSSQNFNTTLNQSAAYKQLGSDRYKMTASAVDIASHNPPSTETVKSMWRPNPDQQIVTTIPGNSDDQINKQNSYYRIRDNQQFINPQNNHHLPNYQSSLYNMKNGGYPGAEMMMPTMPYAVHHSRQNFNTKNNLNVNEHPGVVGLQKVWHYQPATSGIWPNKNNNNNNNGNPIGVLPQQQQQQQQQQQYHHHLQQFQQPIAPASSSSSSSSSSYVKIQPAIKKNLNQNQGNISNNKVTSNVMKKKFIENYSASRYYNSLRENSLVPGAGMIYHHEQRGNANLYLPNPTVVNGGPTYFTVLQDQRIDNGRISLSSSGSMNFGIVYPSQVSSVAPQPINYLKCLKCSRPAPKFNCADCEVASYCNEYCQRSHWPTHSIDCRKKMPKLKKVI